MVDQEPIKEYHSCSCGEGKQIEPHACPYNEDDKLFCTCCLDCMSDCVDDI